MALEFNTKIENTLDLIASSLTNIFQFECTFEIFKKAKQLVNKTEDKTKLTMKELMDKTLAFSAKFDKFAKSPLNVNAEEKAKMLAEELLCYFTENEILYLSKSVKRSHLQNQNNKLVEKLESCLSSDEAHLLEKLLRTGVEKKDLKNSKAWSIKETKLGQTAYQVFDIYLQHHAAKYRIKAETPITEEDSVVSSAKRPKNI